MLHGFRANRLARPLSERSQKQGTMCADAKSLSLGSPGTLRARRTAQMTVNPDLGQQGPEALPQFRSQPEGD
jgi:hypothetical protein